jgi:hypothetical protein
MFVPYRTKTDEQQQRLKGPMSSCRLTERKRRATRFRGRSGNVWQKGGQVKSSNEYRQHAEECRMLARAVHTEEHRAQLMKMAEAWDNFAQEADRRAKLEKQ